MLKVPLQDIKTKIQEKSGLSLAEVEQKIKEKLDSLSGLVSEEGAAHIIANELGVKLFEEGFNGKLQIKNILAGMRNVEVVGKAAAVYDIKEFRTERGEGKVANCMLADETGKVRVVLWNAQADKIKELKEGDLVKITSAYAKENNGKPELHLNDMSELLINPEGVEDIKVELGLVRKKLQELTEHDSEVEVLATIVQVYDPKFFETCPECGKRAREKEGVFVCATHNVVRPDYGYVMNLFIDDGSHNMRAVLWRNQVQSLVGKKHDELVGMKDDAMGFEQVKTELLGTIVKLQGKTNKNEAFDRLEFVVDRVEKDPQANEEIAKLDKELEKVNNEPVVEKPAQEEAVVEEPVLESASEVKKDELKLDEELLNLDDIESVN